MKLSTLYTVLTLTLIAAIIPQAADADDTVYGWQLMSEQERIEHRNKMRSFKTEQEREAYRMEHHKMMQERARQRGVTLPPGPPAMGRGMMRGEGQGNRGGAGKNP